MRALPVLVVLPTLACAAARPSIPSATAEREILAPIPPRRETDAALPTEADVIRWSHDAIDAWDRGDAAALGPVLSAGYWNFEEGTPTGRDNTLADVAKRKSPIFAERVWSHEHVQVREPYVMFVGEAKEHQAGNDVHGGYDFDGSYSLVWCREGGAYKIAFWSWRLAGAGAQRAEWNEIFRNGTGFSKEPNHLLVDAVAKVKPGAALDLAMGQGRNALYLASRGWKVTGVDFSDEGVRAAREAALARHLPLDAVDADLKTFDFGVARWDLVTMIYVPGERALLDRVKKSMKPGALFVHDCFADDDDSFAAGELAALFKDGFDVLRDEVIETTPDWKRDHAKVERFVARKR